MDPLEPDAVPPIGWGALIVILLFTPVALLVVFRLASVALKSQPWCSPSWSLNPFNFSQPLQFFHMGAIATLAYGAVALFRLVVSSKSFYGEALVPFALGIGVLVGIKLHALMFKGNLHSGA